MAKGPYVVRQPDYSDLDLDFLPNPRNADVSIKKGDEAVKRAIRNLIFTNYYEKPFQPEIGSDVTKLLFENMTPMTAVFLSDAIKKVITDYEKRVRVDDITVAVDYDNNGFVVTLKYTILNREAPVITSYFLERIR